MSHYGGGGQFDDADGTIERRIQEELRARQQANSAAAASRLSGALGGHTGFSGTAAERAAFMNSLIAESAAAGNANSPYFAQRAAAAAAGGHSPFARPYGGLGQPGSSPAYGVGHNPNDAVASLYARQRAQYGYGNASGPGGDRNAYAAAYGMPGAPAHDIYGQHYGRPQDKMAMIDRAAAYNAQQRQAEQANPLLQPPAQSPTQSPAGGPRFSQKSPSTPSASVPNNSPRSTSKSATPPSTASPKSRPRKEATPVRITSSDKKKDEKPPTTKDTSENEGITNEDGQKWFSGSVPLGLEDDKYWLSELQVFLRANFAEAFGATEEDIAAPMHGRNKPIALGQVGIRCMHCKRELRNISE